MFCIVLVTMGWCVSFLMNLVYRLGWKLMFVCQEPSTEWPHFLFFTIDCLVLFVLYYYSFCFLTVI